MEIISRALKVLKKGQNISSWFYEENFTYKKTEKSLRILFSQGTQINPICSIANAWDCQKEPYSTIFLHRNSVKSCDSISDVFVFLITIRIAF